MNEHGTVYFFKYVGPQRDAEFGADPEYVPVECRVMESAEGYSIGNNGISLWMRVREYVRCFQEFDVPQPANRTTVLIGAKHTLSERLLMKALSRQPCNICASALSNHILSVEILRKQHLFFVYGNAERQGAGIVAHNKNGPYWHVLTWNNSEEVDEWLATMHRKPEPDVFVVLQV